MILYGLLLTLFIFNCFLLILFILIQKGKGNMGLGSLGGGTQMLFGGSGGQDLFQKITWILGTIFMIGSLLLSLMKSYQYRTFNYGTPTNIEVSQASRQQKMQQVPPKKTSTANNTNAQEKAGQESENTIPVNIEG